MFSVPPWMAVVLHSSHVLPSAKRVVKPVHGCTGLTWPRFPLVSFCRCCSAPAVFLRFRSKNRRCFLIVHGWTWFYAATSLTFRQTRYQALYKDVQCLIADTASIAVRGKFSYTCIHLSHTAVTGYRGGQSYYIITILETILQLSYFPYLLPTLP